MITKKNALSVFFLLGITIAQAQDATIASGGDASGGGGSSSYSVGQVVYTTNTAANGSSAQGVQQPYEISVTVGIENPGINLSATAYPNPTSDFLTLNIPTANNNSLVYNLYDINGKLIETKSISAVETTIHINSLAKAIYFLKIIENNKQVKTFKITKN